MYTVLAPLVTEALAYLESGSADKCLIALRRARDVIDASGLAMITLGVGRNSSDTDSQK